MLKQYLLVAILWSSAGLCVAQALPSALFMKGLVPRLEFSLTAEARAALKADPRTYVAAKLVADRKTTFEAVGLRLKGAAGSFREINDEKPGFTVSLAKFGDANFHGLTKFHLNNAVQDDSYLHEWLGAELMLAAKIPATRCGHARVFLDGRDLGLYVLKEAFDERFLRQHFQDISGNLYDGGFCQDIDAELELDSGSGAAERYDLKQLMDACRLAEPQQRFEALEKLVDIERFLNFMAMELMVGHWDGYCHNRNNYRIYVDARTGKFMFLPHGMDQILGDAEASVLDYPTAMVAEAVMRNPVWRARYRTRISALLALFSRDKWKDRIEAWAERLEKPLGTISGAAASAQRNATRGLIARFNARVKSLTEQVSQPEPRTLSFDARGIAKLQGFTAVHESGAPSTRQTTLGRKRVLEVAAAEKTAKANDTTSPVAEPVRASWRRKMMLARGRYEFRSSVRLDAVTAPPETQAWGARLVATALSESPFLNATADWTPLTVSFEVLEETRLVELRADAFIATGNVAFELATMTLVRLKSE
ncbi:MAG: hypothetical protein EXS14_01410 [Planctomycetes bacterium]|nr:hypothetical protein [Planctomycetota bacterium]